jgi:hypothetical protein
MRTSEGIVKRLHVREISPGGREMTIELPLSILEIRQYQAEQNRISDARVAILRLAEGKRASFNRVISTLHEKGINLAEISMESLKREVELCRKPNRRSQNSCRS